MNALWESVSDPGHDPGRFLSTGAVTIQLRRLAGGSALGGRLDELHGQSVLIATDDQLVAALALIELDGFVRRLVLCTPDLPTQHLPYVIATAEVDAVVSDRSSGSLGDPEVGRFIRCSTDVVPTASVPRATSATEWILFTSGTTGLPKMVIHTLASLAGAITSRGTPTGPAVWGTFYDIRRYGGLQILLRAVIGGGSLSLSGHDEPVEKFLARAGSHGVTHMTGTPSHWRRALMSPGAQQIAPRYARLSGEIADQAILDRLKAVYPNAQVAHAFASTEAGVAFEVGDGHAGFPASFVDNAGADVQMKVEDGSLRIRSPRTALGYLGGDAEPLLDVNGFVDTGDMLDLRDGRYYFVGRRGGIINVGGLKIHPEEVEAVINDHPHVRMSLVKAKKNSITGALVTAEVVLTSDSAPRQPAAIETLKQEILANCRRSLAAHKVPAIVRIVPSLEVTPSGKLVRRDA